MQINPQYDKLRIRGINPEMEAKLDMMFNGAVATGKYVWAPSSGLPPPQNGVAPKDDVISLEGSVDSEESDPNEIGQVTQITKEIGKKRANDQIDAQAMKGKKR